MTARNLIATLATAAALAVVAAPAASAHHIYQYWGCPGNTYGTAFCNSNVTDNEAIWMAQGMLAGYNEAGGNYRVNGSYGPSAKRVHQSRYNLGHDCWVEWHTVPYGYQVTCEWATF